MAEYPRFDRAGDNKWRVMDLAPGWEGPVHMGDLLYGADRDEFAYRVHRPGGSRWRWGSMTSADAAAKIRDEFLAVVPAEEER